MQMISVIIPCYRSEKSIKNVVAGITRTITEHGGYSYEIILVNDGSPDGLWNVIKDLSANDSNIKTIDLSRNFGQHSAIMAGFQYVSGDMVVCMDDDGQTPPEQMFRLIDRLDDGCDLVFARYRVKKHSPFRNMGSYFNEIMLRVLLNKPKSISLMSYFACKRYVIDEAANYKNPYPYVSGLLLRATNKIANVDIDHRAREIGESSYTLKKLISLWMNGFTAFSVIPLRIATIIGTFCSGLGFIYGLITVIKRLLDPDVPMGYSSTMAVMLFIGGLILLMLGIIGEYLGRIYISINNSPQFVVRQTINTKDDELP